MRLSRYLLDVNVLVAIGDERHTHHEKALRWLEALHGSEWGTCAFSQAGFLRIMTNPHLNGFSVQHATETLASLTQLRGYQFWPMPDDWIVVASPFLEQVFGHQQITDAWLLGLVIQNRGILVTFDKGLRHMAGLEFSHHILVLE